MCVLPGEGKIYAMCIDIWSFNDLLALPTSSKSQCSCRKIKFQEQQRKNRRIKSKIVVVEACENHMRINSLFTYIYVYINDIKYVYIFLI